MMHIGIFGRTYPYATAEQIFAAVKGDGYQAVQFNLSGIGLPTLPTALDEAAVKGIASSAARHGLSIAALSGTYNMIHPDLEIRKGFRRGFANVIAAAKIIGAPIVTLCTGSRQPNDMWSPHVDNTSPAAWRDLREEIDFAIGLAAEHELVLGIEPEHGNVIRDAEAARRLLDELDASAPVGIVMDSANLASVDLKRQNEILDRAFGLLSGDIILAHGKDLNAQGVVTCPGDGDVDLSHFIRLLGKTAYTGPLVAHGFEAADTGRGAAKLRALLEANL